MVDLHPRLMSKGPMPGYPGFEDRGVLVRKEHRE